jgi:two-component system chemotaxis sensor kinase CheA
MEKIRKKLQGRSILIVDDDARNTFALVSYLDGMEMNLLTAEDGYQAIELLQVHDEIDIILMDMMMPEMDGFETIARIRSNPYTADIPIISLTAKAMKGDRAKCLEAGASEYVSKPVNMQDLLEKMAGMFNLV